MYKNINILLCSICNKVTRGNSATLNGIFFFLVFYSTFPAEKKIENAQGVIFILHTKPNCKKSVLTAPSCLVNLDNLIQRGFVILLNFVFKAQNF